MATTISGSSGPYKANTPGYYGQNTAFNVQAKAAQVKSLQDVEAMANTNIRYTRENKPQFAADALGYARQDISALDSDKNGSLSKAELAAGFQGSEKIADLFLKALDTNHDGKIDAPEMAAYILFQDDSLNQIKGAAQGLIDSGLLPEADKKALAESYQGPDGKELTSKADGLLTPAERFFAEAAVFRFPNITRLVVEQFGEVFQLRKQ